MTDGRVRGGIYVSGVAKLRSLLGRVYYGVAEKIINSSGRRHRSRTLHSWGSCGPPGHVQLDGCKGDCERANQKSWRRFPVDGVRLWGGSVSYRLRRI
ncbi:hypothetical protein Zmor_016770 [Zophobas morio]|uniref:Uncharacterized protein n=1 Tax=Zophobas morio TaxID=2755281 RepID=A0AA38I7Y8_9CUCU|nr:hypothetical protein Zmor_016770 [Zophobas morio]